MYSKVSLRLQSYNPQQSARKRADLGRLMRLHLKQLWPCCRVNSSSASAGSKKIKTRKKQRCRAKMSNVVGQGQATSVLFFTSSIPEARFFAFGFGHCPSLYDPQLISKHYLCSIIVRSGFPTAAPFKQHSGRYCILPMAHSRNHNHPFFQVAIGDGNLLDG